MISLALLQGIYTALDAALSVDVWNDDVPSGASFPYVVVRNPTEGKWDTLDRAGADATVTIDVWSAYHGDAEALGVAAEIAAVLDDTEVAVPGWSTVRSFVEQVTTLRDPDGVHRRAILTVRVLAQKNA